MSRGVERVTKADFEESLVVYRASSNFIATALQFGWEEGNEESRRGSRLSFEESTERARMTKAGGDPRYRWYDGMAVEVHQVPGTAGAGDDGQQRALRPQSDQRGGGNRQTPLDSTRYGAAHQNRLAPLPAATRLATASPGGSAGRVGRDLLGVAARTSLRASARLAKCSWYLFWSVVACGAGLYSFCLFCLFASLPPCLCLFKNARAPRGLHF